MRGALFTQDFLSEGILATPDWQGLEEHSLRETKATLHAIFQDFPAAAARSEAQTEQDLIFPVLRALGWTSFLTQATATGRGRKDVPDMLLFADEEAKAKANQESNPAQKFRHGIAVVENKAWQRPLDRAGKAAIDGVPSTQILRYLTVAEIHSSGGIQWGILTNGRHWRLYYQRARSRSEEFLELDLPAVLGLEGFGEDLFAPDAGEREHWLRAFVLLFRCAAFLPGAADRRSFHEICLEEGRLWEERVAKDLSDVVFERVFPDLVRAIVANDPGAPAELGSAYLGEVKESALILLYRLLFILYAEDRDLLPVRDGRYDDYGMRRRVREDIARRVDDRDVFAESLGEYYPHMQRLFRAINLGERSLGLPPYNGGLFEPERTPILERVELPDAVFAPIIDTLSRRNGDRPRWINYRDLSVQQLGSIYERLLEFDPVLEDGVVVVRPNMFARKSSGSYYTPDELVHLIISKTVGPLVDERLETFRGMTKELGSARTRKKDRLKQLTGLDPATRILELRVCDAAMGSGHFLVSLVDYLADRILEAIAEAETSVAWAGVEAPYESPLTRRIADLRRHIVDQATENNWAVDEAQLDDRLLVRRIILKRVVHGVDLNPMAVELAKVALWLHTFTVGAPLSFLDHHLRCGNSLFGERVRPVMDELSKQFSLLINRYVAKAKNAADGMIHIENLSDADIGEVRASAEAFRHVMDDTQALHALLDFRQGLRWLGADDLTKKRLPTALAAIFDGSLGDLLTLVTGRHGLHDDGAEPNLKVGGKTAPTEISKKEIILEAARILGRARELAGDLRFFHWQVAFPDVWRQWDSRNPSGGFDAVIGNPPWDRMKLQEVEWFAARRPEIAHAQRAADRKRMIKDLRKADDPLVHDYDRAREMAEAGTRVARKMGEYPLLSRGDINIYSLFVERAHSLVKPDGIVGLLTPSGIASDKGASEFFRGIATTGRLGCLYDFENRRPDREHFFPDVDSRFKFSAVVSAGRDRTFDEASCGFFLHDAAEANSSDNTFAMSSDVFRMVNPNTGTAPVFRTARDAEITTEIYRRVPVLVDRSGGKPRATWPVRYHTMFHMTNDSHLFKTAAALEEEGFYRVEGNRWQKGNEVCAPLYVGRMIHQFDHRAASVDVNEENLHNPALSSHISLEQHEDPSFQPIPQFWVPMAEVELPSGQEWFLGFRDIARVTDVRTVIASLVPVAGFGNKLPLILPDQCQSANFELSNRRSDESDSGNLNGYQFFAAFLVANFNSIVLDYVARQKVQGTNLNWYIVEQLPVLAKESYERTFGSVTARDIVLGEVLKLTYTAHDMAPFARDMGHEGEPFVWDEEERRHSRARLDALYFMLYGIGREDAAYILDTFPIVRRQDKAEFGAYRTKNLILAYMRAFEAGDATARVVA